MLEKDPDQRFYIKEVDDEIKIDLKTKDIFEGKLKIDVFFFLLRF